VGVGIDFRQRRAEGAGAFGGGEFFHAKGSMTKFPNFPNDQIREIMGMDAFWFYNASLLSPRRAAKGAGPSTAAR
jgi:hypothetical protein